MMPTATEHLARSITSNLCVAGFGSDKNHNQYDTHGISISLPLYLAINQHLNFVRKQAV